MPDLALECRTFFQYVTGRSPNEAMMARYADCGRAHGDPTRFDRLHVAFARGGPWRARIADAYAVRFRRAGALRRKLVLVLALAECDGDLAARIDRADGPGPGLWLGLVGAGLASAFATLLGVLLLGPLHLVCGAGR